MSSGPRGYQSSYGAEKQITAAQRLSEMICERQAARNGTQLPARFWTRPEWRGPFHQQVVQANRLLKLYDPEAIFGALGENPRVYSLGAPFFAELCQRKHIELIATRQRLEVATAIPESDTTQPPRQGIKAGKSVRDKLGE